VRRVALGRVLDQRCGALDVTHLVVGAADEKRVRRVLVRPGGHAREHLARLVEIVVPLAEQRVELEQQRVDHLFVGLGQLERLFAHADGLVVVPQRVDVDLGGVEHRLEIPIVERDRLAVALDRLFGVALERGAVPEEVVSLGRLRIELERATRRFLGATRVVARDELPATVEMRRKLIHEERTK
jgi:hypothetical protein